MLQRTTLSFVVLLLTFLTAQVPADNRAQQLQRRMHLHLQAYDGDREAREATGAESTAMGGSAHPLPTSRGSSSQHHAQERRLASAPAPIRIFPEYQLPQSMDSSLQAAVQSVVTAAIISMQQYIKVKVPIRSSGLLATPAYVDADFCNYIQSRGNSSSSCSTPGFYPSYAPNLPSSDIKAPFCGPAFINPEHVLSESCSRSIGSAIYWDGSCLLNAAGSSSVVLADMFLYVTSDQDYCQASSTAQGLGNASSHPGTSSEPCLLDTHTYRPVLGVLNLCPALLQQLGTNSSSQPVQDQVLAAVMHELLHVLGFNDVLFAFFINSTTGLRLGRDAVVQDVPADPGQPQLRGNHSLVITHTVRREVRSQFNCPALEGAALEDQGNGNGSEAGNHWEAELFQGELMAASLPSNAAFPRLSRLTLGLMEDTGWYEGVWTSASFLDWGRGAGCAFAQSTCIAYAASTAAQLYFCNVSSSSSPVCTFNSVSRGQCSTASPFSTCGIVTAATPTPPLSGPTCITPGFTNAADASTEAQGAAAFRWAIGSSARCTQVTLPLTSFLAPSYGGPGGSGTGSGAATWVSLTPQSPTSPSSVGLCWNTSCTGGMLRINIGNASGLACPSNQQLQLSPALHGLSGALTCPDATATCRTLACPASGCSPSGGDCFEGACACRPGRSGTDCSQNLWGKPLPAMKFSSQAPLTSTPPAAPASAPPLPGPPPSPGNAASSGGGSASPVAVIPTRPQTLISSADSQDSAGDSFKKFFPIVVMASLVGCVAMGAAVVMFYRRADARRARADLELQRLQQ